jgi:hypothetical protein
MRRSHCEFPGLDSCTPLSALLYRVVSARKSKIAKEAEVRQRWNQLERARAHLTMLQAIAAPLRQRIGFAASLGAVRPVGALPQL